MLTNNLDVLRQEYHRNNLELSSLPHNTQMQSIDLDLPYASRTNSNFSTSSSDSTCNLVERTRGIGSDGELPFYLDLPLQRLRSQQEESSQNVKRWIRFVHGWRIILFGSWVNILLIFIPAMWAVSSTTPDSHGLVFAFCILAMIPLVKLHDLVTCELALRIGGSKTGLLNASMGNLVEIVVAIIALRKCELRIVQSSLIGSILSKLLLVLGLCFFAGGMRFSEQDFDATATQIHSSLLSISVGAVLLPAAYHFSLNGDMALSSSDWKRNILRMSHGVSVILLFIYASYLVFQLWSHSHLYKDIPQTSNRLSVKVHIGTPSIFKGEKRPTSEVSEHYYLPDHTRKWASSPDIRIPSPASASSSTIRLTPPRRPYLSSASQYASSSELTLASSDTYQDASAPAPAINSTVRLVREAGGTPLSHTGSSLSGLSNNVSDGIPVREDRQSEEQHEQNSKTHHVPGMPQLSWPMTIILLVAVTVMVAVTADDLVESMDGISMTISKEWVALILLPAVNCIAECMTAVNVSVKDQLTLSISVAVGSTIQTALFVIPFMVILGWILDKPLALLFDPFESVVLYISVQTMTYVVGDGKSNWLEGLILIGLYIIIAVSFWFYPGSSLSSSLAVCAVTH